MALFLFAMFEAIAFSWILGVDKGWKLITGYANITVPRFFKFVLKYITPTMLILIFISALVKPMNDDWSLISIHGWELDNNAIIAKLMHKGMDVNDSNIIYIDGARIYLLLLLITIWLTIYINIRVRKKRVQKHNESMMS